MADMRKTMAKLVRVRRKVRMDTKDLRRMRLGVGRMKRRVEKLKGDG